MLSDSPSSVFSLLALILLTTGCGSGYPAVSGKITVNGEPAKNVKVVFSPVSTQENPFPGPFAEGKTDDGGTYSLVTRYGSSGATTGENVVELYSSEQFEVGFLQSRIEMYFAQASGDKNHPSYKAGVALQRELKSLESLNSGDGLTPTVKTSFVVPVAGTDSANFELMDFVESRTAKK